MEGSSLFWRQGRSYYTGDRGRCPNDLRDAHWCCKVIVLLVLAAIPVGLYLTELHQYQLELALDEIEDSVVEVDAADKASFPAAATPIHFTSTYNGSAKDAAFGVSAEHALLLYRETEYCQWQETTTQSCSTCTNSKGSSYSCHCVTTYFYNKGWRSRLIFSAFFNQPFNHDNPQRDPYRSTTLASTNTRTGDLLVAPEVLLNARGTSRRVVYLRPNESRPSYALRKAFGWQDNQRYENVAQLTPLLQSPAYLEHRFVYTGNDGWFFSAYQASVAEGLVKKLGQFLEGSLFDWQLADLLGGCTAGDIRVRFSVLDPQEISVVGKYEPPLPPSPPRVALLDNLKRSKMTIGLVHSGAYSFEVCVCP
jgi:hypothetical protein